MLMFATYEGILTVALKRELNGASVEEVGEGTWARPVNDCVCSYRLRQKLGISIIYVLHKQNPDFRDINFT